MTSIRSRSVPIAIFALLTLLPTVAAAQREDREREPNDTRRDANRVSLGVVAGEISSNEDADYFKIALPEFGILYLDIEAEAAGSPLDAALEIYRSNNVRIAAMDNTDCSYDPELVFVSPEDGTFYIKVFAADGRGGEGFSYRLHLATASVGTEEVVEEDLMNDFISQADLWPIPSIIVGLIMSDDGFPDSDFFAFEGHKGQKVVFDIFAVRNEGMTGVDPSSLDGRLTLYQWQDGEDSVVLAENLSANKADPQIIHTFQEDGPLYLEVEDQWNETGTNHYYFLFVYELPQLHEVPESIFEDCV
ncbi:MAG: hypothetical protein D6812_08940, partial [Deltaproteobacteria bacterium]